MERQAVMTTNRAGEPHFDPLVIATTRQTKTQGEVNDPERTRGRKYRRSYSNTFQLAAGDRLSRQLAAANPVFKHLDSLRRPATVTGHGAGLRTLKDSVCVRAHVLVGPQIELRLHH
jgi:hypothetical protein